MFDVGCPSTLLRRVTRVDPLIALKTEKLQSALLIPEELRDVEKTKKTLVVAVP